MPKNEVSKIGSKTVYENRWMKVREIQFDFQTDQAAYTALLIRKTLLSLFHDMGTVIYSWWSNIVIRLEIDIGNFHKVHGRQNLALTQLRSLLVNLRKKRASGQTR